MAQILLRRALVSDARQVAEVHRRSRACYYGVAAEPGDDREAMWAHLIAQPDRVTYVATVSDVVVGFMSAHRGTDPVAQLKLTAIYVLPSHFDQGIGSRLHDAYASERADEELGTLEVWAGNDRAIGFYLRRGWTPTATTRTGPQDVEFVTYRLS